MADPPEEVSANSGLLLPLMMLLKANCRDKEVVSLLDRLKAPAPSDLSRKRKLAVNKSSNWRSRSTVSRKANEPVTVTAYERVQEFKDDCLIATLSGALFCKVCREELSTKKQNIKVHMSSKKHSLNKEKMKATSKKEQHIAEAMKNYDEETHPKGENLPTGTRVFRVKVVQAFLKSGTPLNRIEFFRDIFEEAGFILTSSSNMRQLIPFVLEEEYKTIMQELLGKEVSLIFDGTTRDGEALTVLARFVENWEVKVRLVRFQLVKSSVNGDELARIILDVLHQKLNVPQGCLFTAMGDRAPVNTKALSTVSILYPEMLDVGCISHFLDRVGTKYNTPVLKQFMTPWNFIFTTSIRGRMV